MSYLPPTTKPIYQEACSRGVLLGRLALHTYAPGHERGSDAISIATLATALQEASQNPFNWTDDNLEAYEQVSNEVQSCGHTACIQASKKGPVGLKSLFDLHIRDKEDHLEHASDIADILTEYQDLVSGAKLGQAAQRIAELGSLLVEPSAFDAKTARNVLRRASGDLQRSVSFPAYSGSDGQQFPAQTRSVTVRCGTGSQGEVYRIFSSDGPFSTINEVQKRINSEFLGTQTAVTRVNAHWNAFQNYANNLRQFQGLIPTGRWVPSRLATYQGPLGITPKEALIASPIVELLVDLETFLPRLPVLTSSTHALYKPPSIPQTDCERGDG